MAIKEQSLLENQLIFQDLRNLRIVSKDVVNDRDVNALRSDRIFRFRKVKQGAVIAKR